MIKTLVFVSHLNILQRKFGRLLYFFQFSCVNSIFGMNTVIQEAPLNRAKNSFFCIHCSKESPSVEAFDCLIFSGSLL